MANIEKDFSEFLMRIHKSMGLDQLSSQLFITLLMEPNEVSIEELSEKTGYSLASISNHMRFLEVMGVAKRIKKPGTSKVFYFVDKDIIKVQINKIDALTEGVFLPAKETVPEIIAKYKKQKLNDNEKQKLDLIIKYYNQILKIEKAINNLKKELLAN